MNQKHDGPYHIGVTVFDPLASVGHARRWPFGASQPSVPYGILSREAAVLGLEIRTIVGSCTAWLAGMGVAMCLASVPQLFKCGEECIGSSNTDMPQSRASISRLRTNETHHPVMALRPSPKQKITFSLPTALIERLRNAVYWTGNRPLASLVEEALEALVTEMEEVNREAFPQRLSPLKAGRRQGKRASASSAAVSYRKSGT